MFIESMSVKSVEPSKGINLIAHLFSYMFLWLLFQAIPSLLKLQLPSTEFTLHRGKYIRKH